MLARGGGSIIRRKWANRRLASVTKIVLITAALLSAYFSLSPHEIMEKAEDIRFSNPNIPMDTATVNSTMARIAADRSGVLHAVWTDPRFGEKNIAYVRSEDNGITWTPVTNISKGWVGFPSMNPDIAVDMGTGPYSDSIYVAYERIVPGNLKDIYISLSRDGGDTWIESIKVDHAPPNVLSLQPHISIGGSGTVYVAWHDMRVPGSVYHIFAARSDDGGLTWPGDFQVSQSYLVNMYAATAADQADNVYVAWQEYNENDTTSILVASSADGINWDTSRVAEGGNYSTARRVPDIVVDDSGSILLTWMFCDHEGNDFLQFSRSDDRGKSWTGPVQVSHGSPVLVTGMVAPRLATARGAIYITWADNRNGDFDIWLAQSVDGGYHWGDGNIQPRDVRVDDTDNNGILDDDESSQTLPDIAVGDFTIGVIWTDYRSNMSYDIYFARYELSFLQITEFSDSPDGNEWIEIFNFGGKPIDAAPYSLRISGTIVDLDPLGTIGPQEYRIVGDAPGADLLVSIDIDDEGADIWLRESGLTKERFYFGQRGPFPDPLEFESVARYWSGERYGQDWNRETIPTFRLENDVPPINHDPEVVLNEVLFNPSNPSDFFVELYYPGWTSFPLNGYKIVCDSESTLGSMTLNPSNREAILRYASDPSLFADMTATGDNVYLYDPSGKLLDMVGWSSPHTQGLSVSRIPDGFGTYEGYNDVTSEMAGWVFDTIPTLWFVRIGPDQAENGEANEQVRYELTVTNKDLSAHYFNINYSSDPGGWAVNLYRADGISPLVDSAGDPDAIPDIGLLNPEDSRMIVVDVTIPADYPVNVVEETRVFATASNDPTMSDFALLRTRPYPDVRTNKTVNPATIFVSTAGPEFQKETTITLEVSGTGSSVEWYAPQDVIFLIDRSWSIGDAFGLERLIALNYLENLLKPDMAAAFYFGWSPQPKRPLDSNFEQVRLDIYSETGVSRFVEYIPPCDRPDNHWPTRPCYTRLGKAIEGALREFEMNGNDSHMHIILLLTDGWHNDWYSMPDWILDPRKAATLAKENGTRIYALGISGRDGINDGILREIANISGGEYMRIDDQHDFDGMYDNISHFVDDTAALDPDPFDSIPMIEDMLPDYVHYVDGTFVDPATGNPRPPDTIVFNPTETILKWFNRVLRVGETWSVSFNVTVSRTGLVSADVYPDSMTKYAMWNGTNASKPFPDVKVLVLPPIHPPAEVWATLEGPSHSNVRIQWTLSEDDPGAVTFYDIYYGTAFNANGDGYALLTRLSSGVDSFRHLGAGEGNPNNYYYRVCAGAFIGATICSSVQAAKFTRPLSSGPNLISIPLVQLDESIETVLQTVRYNKAWHYDSFSQEWKWLMRHKEYSRGLWNTDHTMGLWVNVTRQSNLTVAGIVPAQTTIYLHKGWNLVSFPSFLSYSVSDLKAVAPVERVEGFDSSAPPHFLRVLADSDVLLAGQGYWVKTSEDATWVVSNG